MLPMDKSALPERLSLSATKPERSSVSQGPSVVPINDWVSSNSDAPANSTPILSAAERQRLLVEFNDTSRDYPRGACVHELFEQQVERTPEAVALVFEDQQLTYRELNERSNRLARYLQARGVTTQTPVGLCVERSLDLVVSILGIFKAGGYYVPLDAEYPTQRLGNMLEVAKIEYLVTHSGLIGKLPRSPRLDICLDTEGDAIAKEASENLEIGQRSDQLAYVMFTSGSTGEPKGVMIEHRSIARLVINSSYARF